MAQRSNPALSKPVIGRSLSRLNNYYNGEKSAAHSILARSDSLQQRPYTFAQTNFRVAEPSSRDFPEARFSPVTGACPVTRRTRTLRNRIRSLDRRHAWGYTGNRGGYHEDRSNRRQWTHRIKARHQASWAGTRGNRGVTPIGCQHSHRRRTGRSAEGRVGGR